jgi:hypothetical protein
MLGWLMENATSVIVIVCSIVLGVRQNLIRRQIEDLRKEVLNEMLNTNLSIDEDGARDVSERQNIDFLINRG